MGFKTSKSFKTSRTVLITGCSSGIGYCVAHGLKKRGYSVFATARQPKDVARLQQEGLESLVLDLTNSQSIFEAVQTVLERSKGQLYGLFNNGGYAQFGACEDLTREVLRQQFETNLFGTHELTRQVIPIMRRQNEGRIIQNSSLLGIIVWPYLGAYSASKFALEGLTDTLRLELAATGISVSLIESGTISSNIIATAHSNYRQHIDVEHSSHREMYVKLEQRFLDKKHDSRPLPPELVLKKVIHALESKHPQPRYYVPFSIYWLIIMKRLLPHRTMDWILRHSFHWASKRAVNISKN